MPNHFHLLVRSVRGNLSVCMKNLLGPYTQELNYRHNWDGPVFRGRFRNQLVSESEHLQVLLPYIHLNPVRARLVTAPEFGHWTSYADYLGITKPPKWLTTATVLSMYETVDNLVAETLGYHTGELKWPRDFDLRRGMFKTWSPEIPRTHAQVAAWKDRQVEWVREVHGIVTCLSWEQVFVRAMGRGGNPARRLAVWLLATRTDLTYKQIAEVIKGNSNEVTQMLHFIRKARFGEPLANWVRRADFWVEEESEQRTSNANEDPNDNRG